MGRFLYDSLVAGQVKFFDNEVNGLLILVDKVTTFLQNTKVFPKKYNQSLVYLRKKS